MLSLRTPVYDEAQKHDIKNFDSPSLATTGLMPPSALPSVDFVLRLAHSLDIEHTYTGGNDHGAPQKHHDIAPVDGDGKIVWFCSGCNDGPYGDWQTHCQMCQHVKCSSCRTEKN